MAFGGDMINIWLLDLLLSDFSFTNIYQFWCCISLYCYVAREVNKLYWQLNAKRIGHKLSENPWRQKVGAWLVIDKAVASFDFM